MSRSSPFMIMLSGTDRAELERGARCYSLPHAEVIRAKIVLLAAGGLENTMIAARLDVHVGVVSRWRKRFVAEGMAGLADRQRSGRPRVFPAVVVVEVKAMACQPPEDRGVADNGSSHRGQASIDRMAAAWPNAVLVHLPVHASWLNQVEVVFSVIQRKVIKPSDIGDADALAARLLAFQDRYNTTAKPFDWKFTRSDLDDLCQRIDARRSRGSVSLAA